MSDLRDLQQVFQRAVLLDEHADVAAQIAGEDPSQSITRLQVYAHAYRSRLQAALESNFPMLRVWLGAQVFAELANDYISAHPSQHFSIRPFGELLPSWLERLFGDRLWIAEFARWEWALGAAFDAPDATPLKPQALADLSADDWPALRFDLHPAVQFFTAHTNAPLIFKALAEENAVPDPAITAPNHFVVWRGNLTPRYRPLDADEYDALQALRTGASFEALCTIIGEHRAKDTATRAASLLREWLDAHLLCKACTSS